ncbi:cupredoxin family protein [Alicycliphilus denitrificans]|uniref:Cupredoxin family protein n=1 Tax=Alicycliphilus denitrificans TaxID=179636 RepID=A0A858ZRS3_9BURK|nr:cupredoxin family protein [Alicycliphilus denitrificans]ADU99212.1 blue (type 1) copper domain protein [Alicycliphilus denitrificans BC]QKD43487.1 cupredoxin family protein [Alicycliphilus denitrificans]GAO27339.1 blue copper domain-containing protein [Alicycliphilus sp. B1]
MKTIKFIAACALLVSTSHVFSHENASHGSHAAPAPQQQAWGIAGQAREATRTITLRMTDDMRFTPAQFKARVGETVRLRVENKGKVLHEVVLGTQASLAEHAAMMREHPGMAHAEAHMAHVAPGGAQDLVWRFNRAGSFDFACLVAGHYEAGMRGTFTVTP